MEFFTQVNGVVAVDDSKGERTIAQQVQVALYDRDQKTTHEDGLIWVSTHRLFWTSRSSNVYTLSVLLSQVVSAEGQPGFWMSSPKVVVRLQANKPESSNPGIDQLRSMFPNASVSLLSQTLMNKKGDVNAAADVLLSMSDIPLEPAAPKTTDAFVKLSFRGGGLSQFLSSFQEALDAKAWLKEEKQVKSFDSSSIGGKGQTPLRAGITGIKANIERSQQETSQMLEASFKDLNALMAKASDLVKVAEKLTAKLEKEGDDAQRSEMRSYLLSMGIANPVVKETAGGQYFNELSVQLAEFLKALLKQRGGMMTLPDVYCFFNRARGTALVSPEDLHHACELFDKLKQPIKYRLLDSGVRLVQLDSYEDAAVSQRVSQLVTQHQSLSPLDLARIETISVVLAKEQLLITEKLGLICRDDSTEGLRFFPNLFK